MKSLVIIPTFNELENVGLLVPRLRAASPETDVLIVDDNSPDGTADAVRQLRAKDPAVDVLLRKERSGFADAVIAGLQQGLDGGYDSVIQMDADLSHPPEVVPQLLKALETTDVVVGSRYMPGGGVKNWAWYRRWMSRLGNWYAQHTLGIPLTDLTGGFVGWKASALSNIRIKQTRSRGYAFLIELKYRAFLRGLSLTQVPFTFPDRIHGQSKMTAAIFGEAFRNVLRLRLNRKALIRSFDEAAP